MKATIVEGVNKRTATILPFGDGYKKVVIFQTRQLGGAKKWDRPIIDWPQMMTATAEQAEVMILGLQEAVRIYNQWLIE